MLKLENIKLQTEAGRTYTNSSYPNIQRFCLHCKVIEDTEHYFLRNHEPFQRYSCIAKENLILKTSEPVKTSKLRLSASKENKLSIA